MLTEAEDQLEERLKLLEAENDNMKQYIAEVDARQVSSGPPSSHHSDMLHKQTQHDEDMTVARVGRHPKFGCAQAAFCLRRVS